MENLTSYQFATLSDISNLSFLFNLVCTPCTLNFAIDYNPEGVVGKGSAIFLHCQGKGTTAGCISIPESNMVYLLQHLRSDAKIIIDYETNIGLY